MDLYINNWLNTALEKLQEKFAENLLFVGLQGSHNRGEATETSDIDVVVILDELSALDIESYNTMLDTLPKRELMFYRRTLVTLVVSKAVF